MGKVAESGIIYHSPNMRSREYGRHFIIPGVVYREQTGTYAIFEQMTPSMNQEMLAEFYEKEKQKGNPHPTDAPLIWAIAIKSYELKNQKPEASERLRKFLQQGFKIHPNTLTRVAYNKFSGKDRKDKIIHNYKTLDEYSIYQKVVGPDGFVNYAQHKRVLEALLGTSDVSKINRMSQWINETNNYFWRLNSKPNRKFERTAWFCVSDSRFGLNCNGGPNGKSPAFQVLKVD